MVRLFVLLAITTVALLSCSSAASGTSPTSMETCKDCVTAETNELRIENCDDCITAGEIMRAYETPAVREKHPYDGNRYKVVGTITGIQRGMGVCPCPDTFWIKSGGEKATIIFPDTNFDNDEILAPYGRGDTIIANCLVEGIFGYTALGIGIKDGRPAFADCKIP